MGSEHADGRQFTSTDIPFLPVQSTRAARVCMHARFQ